MHVVTQIWKLPAEEADLGQTRIKSVAPGVSPLRLIAGNNPLVLSLQASSDNEPQVPAYTAITGSFIIGLDEAACVFMESTPDEGTVIAYQTSPFALYAPQEGLGGEQVVVGVAFSVVLVNHEQELAADIEVAPDISSFVGIPTVKAAERLKNCPRDEGPACTSYAPRGTVVGMVTEKDS